MIARITYLDGDLGQVTATLHEDGTWTGDDEETIGSLNALISAEDKSPARGDWMGWHAEKMAKVLGASIEFEAKEAPPADMLY